MEPSLQAAFVDIGLERTAFVTRVLLAVSGLTLGRPTRFKRQVCILTSQAARFVHV